MQFMRALSTSKVSGSHQNNFCHHQCVQFLFRDVQLTILSCQLFSSSHCWSLRRIVDHYAALQWANKFLERLYTFTVLDTVRTTIPIQFLASFISLFQASSYSLTHSVPDRNRRLCKGRTLSNVNWVDQWGNSLTFLSYLPFHCAKFR